VSALHEVELKLAAPPGFRLPDLAGLMEGVHAEGRPAAQLTTTYWDTSDLRLAGWGSSLRFRLEEGWTVKLPGEVADGVLSRPELSFQGSPERPPREAEVLVRAFVRRETLAPVARLRAVRHRIDLVRDGTVTAASVTLDEVAVLDGVRVARRFREVEVELGIDPPDGLLPAVRERLTVSGAGAADPTSKLARALGPRMPAGAEVPEAHPGADSSTEEIVAGAIGASVRRFIHHDPLVRLSQDPEAVHQCRVATRRLRSDLRTFRPLLDRDRTEPIRDELRWLGRALGTVREADVMAAQLQAMADDLPAEDRVSAERLFGRLEQERGRAQAELIETLDQDRALDLLDRLVALSRTPAMAPGNGGPSEPAIPPLIDTPWKRLRKAVSALDDEPSDEALHQVRIRAKRCRYAAEAIAPVVGKDAAAFAKAAADLQDLLGGHQDAVMAEGWLRAASTRAGGRQALAAGQLVARLATRRASTWESFPATWKRLKRKGPDTWA
jgi:CHAD domain-containing protein